MTTRFHFFYRKSIINYSKLILKPYLTCISKKCFIHFHEQRNYSTHVKLNLPSITSTELELLNRKFIAVIPELIQTIADTESDSEISEIKESFQKLLEYNLFDGKRNRGIQTVIAYHMFSSQLDEESLKLASLLGWCVELLQAFYLVHDDIIDGAEMRRGRPCWYRFQNNGLNAINDGVLLEQSIFVILRKYFRNKPYYVEIIEKFQDVVMKTSIGQILDTKTSRNFQFKKQFDQFTVQNYSTIVKYKTGYYSFQLPVILAMYMAGINDKTKHEKATNVLLNIGKYYQVQDDVLDCFGDKKIIGKLGNDIAEGKCTWLILNALNRANIVQRWKLQENYGSSDLGKIENVIKIYNELGLKDMYDEYEKQTYNELKLEINDLGKEIPSEVFTSTLNRIHRREC